MLIDVVDSRRTSLLVVDVQEKLIHAIHGWRRLLLNIEFLIDSYQLLDLPIHVTEQYPQGLGPTVSQLSAKLAVPRPEKKTFSCSGAPGLFDSLTAGDRNQIVVCGIESHVCVSQTCFDLVKMGLNVTVAVDAVSARYLIDHDFASDRLRQIGCVLSTCEAIGFELLKSADHPRFKAFSKLVQERSRKLQSLGE